MSRDDSFLWSGITSVTAEVDQTPRETQKEIKEKVLRKLKPAAEIVLAEIKKEQENVVDIRSFVLDPKATEAEVLTEMKARKLYLGYLNSLESKITNLVKEPRKKKVADE